MAGRLGPVETADCVTTLDWTTIAKFLVTQEALLPLWAPSAWLEPHTTLEFSGSGEAPE